MGASKDAKGAASAGGSTISKTIGWMNKNAGLMVPITFSEVSPVLTSIGEEAAGQLLNELGEKAMTIKDPTKWLLAAAKRQASGEGKASTGKSTGKSAGKSSGKSSSGGASWGSGGGAGGVSKQIGYLNKSGKLIEPIMFDEVKVPLAMVREGDALALLKELGEKAAEIKSPTAWLKAAAIRRSQGGGRGGAVAKRGGMSSGGFGGLSFGVSKSISKQIGLLNKSETLAGEIKFDDVSPALAVLPEGDALMLIAELEDKAADVKNPTAWLKGAAMRALSTGRKVTRGSELSKRIGQLNKNSDLKEAISWSDVCGPLSCIPRANAMALLDEFESKASEIKAPTNWLVSAANRAVKRAKTSSE